MSSGLRSAAMLREYFGDTFNHRPERSGLPSGARGAGALRFGLPSAVRGRPAVGCVNHCAPSDTLNPTAIAAMSEGFTAAPSGAVILTLRVVAAHVRAGIRHVVELGAVRAGLLVVFGTRERVRFQRIDPFELGWVRAVVLVASIVGLLQAVAAIHVRLRHAA